MKLSHTRGGTTLEGGYDQAAATFSCAATQRVAKKSTLKASYDQKGEQTSLEWSRQGSDDGGPFKVSSNSALPPDLLKATRRPFLLSTEVPAEVEEAHPTCF